MAVDVVEPSGWNPRALALLRESGLRFSRPRAAILGFFLAGDRHISAESLHRSLLDGGASLSLSTVYLNLSVLCEAGLIRELKGLEGVSLYDSNVVPHGHMVCTVTGEVVDVPELEVAGIPLGRFLKEVVETATGWQVAEPTFSFEGLSPQALSKKR